MHKFLVIALLTSAASGAQALGSKDFDNFVTMKHSKSRDGTGYSITIWIDTRGEVPTVVQRCLGGNDSNPTTKGLRIGKLGEKPVTYYFNDFENPNCEWLTER